MRVVFVTAAPFVSGAERSLQTTIEFLPSVGVEPFVLCPPDAMIVPWCTDRRVPVLACKLAPRDKWHPFQWWSSLRTGHRLLRESRPDLIHSNQIWSYPLVGHVGSRLGVPRVCHLRDETSAEGIRYWCAAGVEAILCISRHIEQQITGAWPPPSAPVVKTLINPVRIPSDADLRASLARGAELRYGLGLPGEAVVFGFIGQLSPVKGLLELLEALAGLDSRGLWHLLVAGRDPRKGTPYANACVDRISRLGLKDRVSWLGYLEDPDAFFGAIDIAVVPSLEEPLGRVPLEAGAYGKPTVAFSVGGLPETIRQGETGWLVPPRDFHGFRSALISFIESRPRDAGLAARAWAESACHPQRYVQALAQIYSGLLRG